MAFLSYNNIISEAQSPSMTGLPPFATYDASSFETINLSNLDIHFELPIRSTPGRRLPFKATLQLDTNVVGVPVNLATVYPAPAGTPQPTGNGWQYPTVTGWNLSGVNIGLISYNTSQQICNYAGGQTIFNVYSNFSYRDAHQTVHQFPSNIQVGAYITATNGSTKIPCPTFTGNPASGSTNYNQALDGSSYSLDISYSANGPSWGVVNMQTGVWDDWYDGYSNSNYGGQDATGNTVLTFSSTANQEKYSYNVSDGTSRSITANYTTIAEQVNTQCPGMTNEQSQAVQTQVLSSLAYPDGTSYTFTYDILGRPVTITLPTGGTITYSYPSANQGVSCEDGGTAGFTKTTPDGTWTYSRTFNSSTNLWTTQVVDPQNNVTVYTFGGTPGSSYDLAPISSEYEIKRVYYQGSSTVMKTMITCYNGNYSNCDTDSTPTGSAIVNYYANDVPPSVKDVYTYIPGVTHPSLSETHIQEGQVIEDKEYDFGGAQTPPSAPGNGFISDRNIQYGWFGCVTSDVMTDSSGTTWAKTTQTCDSLGNATVTNRWISGSTYATTYQYFDSTHGLLYKTTDANGNSTLYSNTLCSNSFPSSITVGQTSAYAGLATSMQWDCSGEVPTQSVGPNSQATTYAYSDASGSPDPFWRLLQTTSPDGGKTSTIYTPYDAATSTSATVEADQTIDSSNTMKSVVTLDSLGRKIQSAITSDIYGSDYVDTTYNSLGQVASVTTPYQSTTDTSYGITGYTYDALGRPTAVNIDTDPWRQNSTTRSFSYSGNVTTITDERSNLWTQTYDALGRLTQVSEPSTAGQAPNLNTTYSYYPSGNLHTVTQAGIAGTDTARGTRSFVYDGLSRLTSATNPETGTTTYSYDSDGNLLQKSSPLPNAAVNSGSQVIGYCYDSLNHLVGKWSAAPPSGCNSTPSASSTNLLAAYTYGAPNATSQNSRGLLIDEQSYLNGTLLTDRAFSSYDAMGRSLTEQQNPYSPSSAATSLNYSWNYAGTLASISDPTTGIGFSYQMDSANRLKSITSTLTSYNGLQFPNLLYSVTNYGAAGMTSAQIGGDPNNTGLFNQTRVYDNRGRIMDNEIYATSTDTFSSGTVTISGTENPCVSGSGANCVADTGEVAVTVTIHEGYSITQGAHFGASDTVESIATTLAQNINQYRDEPISASISDSGPTYSNCQNGFLSTSPTTPCVVVTLTARVYGQYENIPLSAVETDVSSSSPSFAVTASGTTLTGGTGSPQGNEGYTYTLRYDGANNITDTTDPFNGSWTNTYDPLNRLVQSQLTTYQAWPVTTPQGAVSVQCWSYDSFGNRTFEADLLQSSNPTSCPTPLTTSNATHRATYDAANRISGTDLMPAGYGYDGAGNVVLDAWNLYVYDAEGRVCATKNLTSGAMTQYIYDAEGRRVGKGTMTSWPATGATCSAPTSANGFALTSSYLRSVNGTEDLEVWPSSGAWRMNVFAQGSLLATYNFANAGQTPLSLSFALNDWLGTKRAEVNQSGQLVNWWKSDPFGNYLTPRNSTADPSEQHFTGKERDSESGNDYFGARYYGSSMGRFMSPDPSGLMYADPTNPQSLNLYSYAWNNPLRNVDPTGLDACAYDNGDGTAAIVNAADGGSVDCPGNGFYITTSQQVTAVGFNNNGDLGVYGADGNLYNPDGSAYNAPQSISVSADGGSSYVPPPTILGNTGFISTQNAPTGYQSNYPDYKSVFCAGEAMQKNGIALSLDAAGFIPGEGFVAAGVQTGVAAASALNSASQGDKFGAYAGITGMEIALPGAAMKSAGVSAAKAVPFVGTGVNTVATLHDLGSLNKDYQECMSRL